MAKKAAKEDPSVTRKKARERAAANAHPTPQNLTPKQAAFLAAYRESGSVTVAAKAAKIHRRTHYDWLEHEPYRSDFFKARENLAELLLDEAIQRAVAGSDRLLEFLLKGLKPEIFNRQRVEITPSGPGMAGLAVWQLSDEQLEEEIRRFRRVCES